MGDGPGTVNELTWSMVVVEDIVGGGEGVGGDVGGEGIGEGVGREVGGELEAGGLGRRS